MWQWQSLLRSMDRFSLQNFKYTVNELREIKVVDKHNREFVIDLLQSIVEIVTYGDRQDPLIFECFMEYQVLAEFVRVLKNSRNSKIEAPILQYLSIMIQNMDSEQAIYYCFSNDYINNIIAHPFEFDTGDLAQYYVSFLRAVSGKINRDTLCLLVKVHGDSVLSFPLYSEALKFAHYGEKMIQTAIRALTLSIYNVSDDMVYQFITTPPISKYFSDLVDSLRDQCFRLDNLAHATSDKDIKQTKEELLLAADQLTDDLYYIKDILSVGNHRLSRVVTEKLLSILVFPVLLPLLQLRQNSDSNLSAVTSLYIVSRLLQVVGGKHMINSVAGVVLYSFMNASVKDPSEGKATLGVSYNSFFNHLSEINETLVSRLESEGTEMANGNYCSGYMECASSNSDLVSSNQNIIIVERGGVFASIIADDHNLLLEYLFLLLMVADSEDLDSFLAPIIGLNGRKTTKNYDRAASEVRDGSILQIFLPQILNALLKILAIQPPLSVLIQWHTGWFLCKLLIPQEKRLDDDNLQLLKTSYEQSLGRFKKELDGCWVDYIPDTLGHEWASLKAVLEESSRNKDPIFSLELALSHQKTTPSDGDSTSFAWKRMVDSVKVFVLHLHLLALIMEDDSLEEILQNMMNTPPIDSGKVHASDVASATFGSEVSLGSGISCRIAFSNAGVRDIYVIPVARGIAGKLLLAEKLPFRSLRGVVIAIAPLAGLSPTINEDHPTWLHLRIREFNPTSNNGNKVRGGNNSKMPNQTADGKWTLGFPNAKACETARLSILGEISKQRSFVESILSPFLLWNTHQNG